MFTKCRPFQQQTICLTLAVNTIHQLNCLHGKARNCDSKDRDRYRVACIDTVVLLWLADTKLTTPYVIFNTPLKNVSCVSILTLYFNLSSHRVSCLCEFVCVYVSIRCRLFTPNRFQLSTLNYHRK